MRNYPLDNLEYDLYSLFYLCNQILVLYINLRNPV